MSRAATHSNDNDVTTTELEPIVSAKDAQPSGTARCPSHLTKSDSSRDQGRGARHLINPRSASRECWREGPLNKIKHCDAWDQQQTRKKWAPRDQTAPTALMSQNSARPPGKSPVEKAWVPMAEVEGIEPPLPRDRDRSAASESCRGGRVSLNTYT